MSPSFCGSGPYPCGSLTYRVRGQYTTASNTVSRKFFFRFCGNISCIFRKRKEIYSHFPAPYGTPRRAPPSGGASARSSHACPRRHCSLREKMKEKGGTSVKKCRCFCAAPRRGGPRLSSGGFCSAEVFQQIKGIRAETRIPSGTSGPVSRVLSFKTAIYLDALLPTRSSRLPGTAGPAYVSLHGVAPDRVYSDGRFHTPSGELLPHLSTFAAPWRGGSLFLLHFS